MFGLPLVYVRVQRFVYRLPEPRIPSIAFLLDVDMGKAEKVERFRFPFSTPPPLVDCMRTEFQQPRLLGMQFQVELPHSFCEFRPKLIGIRFLLESQHDIVSKAHDDHIPVSMLPSPCLDPQAEYVMKVDVRQKRRRTSAPRRPFLYSYSFPILQHTRAQPFVHHPATPPLSAPP